MFWGPAVEDEEPSPKEFLRILELLGSTLLNIRVLRGDGRVGGGVHYPYNYIVLLS